MPRPPRSRSWSRARWLSAARALSRRRPHARAHGVACILLGARRWSNMRQSALSAPCHCYPIAAPSHPTLRRRQSDGLGLLWPGNPSCVQGAAEVLWVFFSRTLQRRIDEKKRTWGIELRLARGVARGHAACGAECVRGVRDDTRNLDHWIWVSKA